MMLVELEYYVFESVEYSTGLDHAGYSVGSSEGLGEEYSSVPRFGPHKGYHKLPPEDRYLDFRNRTVHAMEQAGIPVKYHHHEVGASQLEIELDFMDLVRAADSVCVAKWIIRTVAEEMGLSVTFMPKPSIKCPAAECTSTSSSKRREIPLPRRRPPRALPGSPGLYGGAPRTQPHGKPPRFHQPGHQQLPPPRPGVRSPHQRHLRQGLQKRRGPHTGVPEER